MGEPHVITWAKSFRRRSTSCRGVQSSERNFPPVAASNFGLGYHNGKTRFNAERTFPLSAGPKIRLSEAIRYQRTGYPSTLRRTLRSYQIKHGSRPHLARHRHQRQNRPGTIYQASKNRGIVGDSRALLFGQRLPNFIGEAVWGCLLSVGKLARILTNSQEPFSMMLNPVQHGR